MEILDERTESAILSEKAISDINKTTPWMKFMAILGFIFMGLAAIVFLGIFGAGLASGSGAMMIGLLFPILYLALQFWILTSLYSYASRLKEFAITKNSEYLERAFCKAKKLLDDYWHNDAGFIIIYLIAIFTMGAQMANVFRQMQHIR